MCQNDDGLRLGPATFYGISSEVSGIDVLGRVAGSNVNGYCLAFFIEDFGQVPFTEYIVDGLDNWHDSTRVTCNSMRYDIQDLYISYDDCEVYKQLISSIPYLYADYYCDTTQYADNNGDGIADVNDQYLPDYNNDGIPDNDHSGSGWDQFAGDTDNYYTDENGVVLPIGYTSDENGVIYDSNGDVYDPQPLDPTDPPPCGFDDPAACEETQIDDETTNPEHPNFDPQSFFKLECEYVEDKQSAEYASCLFSVEAAYETKDFLNRLQELPFIIGFKSMLSIDEGNNLTSNVQKNADGQMIVDDFTSSAYQCPEWNIPDFNIGLGMLSTDQNISLCSDNFDIMFNVIYFLVVFMTVFYSIRSFFGGGNV
jgi:hypothetical protein